jgi:hypothetical protein
MSRSMIHRDPAIQNIKLGDSFKRERKRKKEKAEKMEETRQQAMPGNEKSTNTNIPQIDSDEIITGLKEMHMRAAS